MLKSIDGISFSLLHWNLKCAYRLKLIALYSHFPKGSSMYIYDISMGDNKNYFLTSIRTVELELPLSHPKQLANTGILVLV